MTGQADQSKKRASDQSHWWRISDQLAKYKVLIWAVVAVLLAAGFGYRTPKQAFDSLGQDITRINVRVDTLYWERAETIRKLDVLIRLQCLTIPLQIAQASGINCNTITKGP